MGHVRQRVSIAMGKALGDVLPSGKMNYKGACWKPKAAWSSFEGTK